MHHVSRLLTLKGSYGFYDSRLIHVLFSSLFTLYSPFTLQYGKIATASASTVQFLSRHAVYNLSSVQATEQKPQKKAGLFWSWSFILVH
jgi:hypothetical protein